MFQRTTIATTVAVTMFVYVGTADGKAKKIKFFTPSQEQIDDSVGALGDDADPDGMAILNYSSGADKTIVQIIISDMTPLTPYSIRLEDGLGVEEVLIDAITTDEDGHGTLHLEFPGIDISKYDVVLFVGTTTTGAVWSQQPDASVVSLSYGFTAVVGDATQDTADDFSFADDTTITTLRWLGGTANGDPTQSFEITIHADASGVPGAAVFGPATVTPGSAVTGRRMDGGNPGNVAFPDEFEYDAVLPDDGFMATAGVIYWLEIGGIQTGTIGAFIWSAASAATGNGNEQVATQFINAGSLWTLKLTTPDRAFELDAEIDTTEERASGCNPDGVGGCP